MTPQDAPGYDLRLVPAALTCWAVTAAGIVWQAGVAATVTGAVGAGVAALLRRRTPAGPRRAVLTAVLAAALVGLGFGAAITLRDNDVRQHPILASVGRQAEVTVLVTETPRVLGSGRLLMRADLRLVGGAEMRGRVVVFASADAFGAVSAGQSVRFRTRIAPPTRRDLTVAVLTASGRPTVGAATPVQRGAQRLRSRLAEAGRTVLPAEAAALLPALVLGDTSMLPPELVTDFRTAGLTHLTAVSGANVTIVCGAVLLSAAVVGLRVAVLLAAVVLVAFVVVVQPTASVLRAAVMGAITLLAVVSARRRQAIPALAATVIGLLALAPQLAVDIGFALSVSATAALVVLAPLWSRRLVARGWPKPLADAICVALAAQLVTAPLIAGLSGSLSLVAVVANVLVAPVIAPITVLGTAAAAVAPVLPAAGGLLIRFTGPELWWLLQVAHGGAAVPHAAVPVPSGPGGALMMAAAVMASVVLWRRRPFRLVMAAAAVCLLAWAVSAGLGVGGT
ncbi:ComEC/Rec2-like protein [Mycolicibacterium tokaiense]|uniref:ComEC/Rec2-like protein n=1 Tax=Mycolicibacterium tokaiense TaxID=39695 RepID=A0A378TLD7_9MYCO|nr:competence protein [Mycolicibacterium tokaiense]STZ61440.1 ComEC/Rec2-like protein [Mycolicibacterium tokaiense]